MSSSSSVPQSAPARQRGAVPYVVAGCALLALCVLCAALAGGAYSLINQRQVTTGAGVPSVEYILDATARMSQPAEGENDTRLNVARGVLAEIVRPSDPTVTAGLRVFGAGAPSAACTDTNLLVPLAPASQGQISTHLLALTTGTNPAAAMSQAIVAAIRDLAAITGKHTLVVVTGGADSCNPQAGALIASEAQKAGIDMQFFMIGFQVPNGDGTAIKGVVDSSGGTYIEADNKEKLREVVGAIQVYVADHNSSNTAGVLATVAAAVGPQNVATPGTPQPAATIAPNATTTPASGGNASPTTAATTVATSAATAAATPGGSGTGGTGQTACDHPYFPMRPGATWTFSGTDGNFTWTILDVTGDQNSANATMQFTIKDITGTYHWHCTPAGIESYDFGSISTGSGTAVDYKITKHSGIWLAPASQLTPGTQWDSAYTLEGTVSGVTFTDDVVQHFTVGGIEKISAAGADHDAVRIEDVSHTTVSGVAGGTTLDINSTYWLARGIGPVQWSTKLQTGGSTSVLQSYSIP